VNFIPADGVQFRGSPAASVSVLCMRMYAMHSPSPDLQVTQQQRRR